MLYMCFRCGSRCFAGILANTGFRKRPIFGKSKVEEYKVHGPPLKTCWHLSGPPGNFGLESPLPSDAFEEWDCAHPRFPFFSINTAHLQSMCERERYSAMTKKGNNDNDYRTSHWQLLLYWTSQTSSFSKHFSSTSRYRNVHTICAIAGQLSGDIWPVTHEVMNNLPITSSFSFGATDFQI